MDENVRETVFDRAVPPRVNNVNNDASSISSTPSPAYMTASWVVLIVGIVAYLIGLYNAEMELNEKGYYLTILLFGLFSAVALQKCVRDKMEGIPVTAMFVSISWFGLIAAILLLIIGLWNAELWLSEKGFYGISYLLSIYSAITVQKNIRDSRRQ